MSAEVLRVLASDAPALDERYGRTLFAAEQAYAGSCTARCTVCAASIASAASLRSLLSALAWHRASNGAPAQLSCTDDPEYADQCVALRRK